MWRRWHGGQEYSDSWSGETRCDWSSVCLASPGFASRTLRHCYFAGFDPSWLWTILPNSPRSYRDRNAFVRQAHTPANKSSLSFASRDSLAPQRYRRPAVSDQDKRSPIVRRDLTTVFCQQIYLCVAQRSGLVLAFRNVGVKPLHQGTRIDVVRTPQARDDCLSAADKECFHQVRDAFLPLELSNARVAGGERHEVGIKMKSDDLADLQYSIVT